MKLCKTCKLVEILSQRIYCSKECELLFRKKRQTELGGIKQKFRDLYGKPPTDNELEQFVENRTGGFKITD